MSNQFKLISATWDKGPKTKFLSLVMEITVYTEDAEVNVTQADLPGTTETRLVVDVEVVEGSGPMEGHMQTFEPSPLITIGNEPWTHVNARYGDLSDSVPITVLENDGDAKGDGDDTGGPKLKGDGGSGGGSKRQEGADNDWD